MIHQPVLLTESLDYLIANPNGVYFDATIGFGGHSTAILDKLSENAKLIGSDKDITAYNYCKDKFQNDKRVVLYNCGFKNINLISKIEFLEGFDGIFADLGVSSFQLDDSEAGFTYREDVKLDLRMDKKVGEPASHFINTLPEEELANIFYLYGEEKKSRHIARKIEKVRKEKSIDTTGQLKEIIESVVPGFYSLRTLSRIFQALRIYVNDEIGELKEFLVKAIELLKPGGRVVILSYHSLEDREVKDIFKYETIECICPVDLPVCVCDKKKILKILTKKPIVPSEQEIKNNSRARSAKLRAAEKI